MQSYDIVIVGGGAAGFFAALTAAEATPNTRILILEKARNPLAKVRVSGGGRCNVTHACYDPTQLITYYPRGGKELRGPFTRFQPRDTVAWFGQRGVRLKTEADGRIFPVSDQSQTIIDCFLDEARKHDIELRTATRAKTIQAAADGFTIQISNAADIQAAKVLLAAGGGAAEAYTIAAGFGHTIVPPVPSLFTFEIKEDRLNGLAGISLENVELALTDTKGIAINGALLITHWGLSGPAVLKLSAWSARELAQSNYRSQLQVNWYPPHTPASLFAELENARRTQARKHALKTNPTKLPTRLWQRLAATAGIGENHNWGDLSNAVLHRLADELTRGTYTIQGKGVFKEEFVTCGGISLKEVDFKTMQSRLQPGLFFAGEILDIDALTGGFNFQSAWTTGWLAGHGMVL
ncbi:MAG: NAD(P)/FAD-dependent oxidoreductase [Anaerolineales bacterium]|nr:NAD(P)/FAD-dependent oxidoreductase [Anaerolineales bacterium]